MASLSLLLHRAWWGPKWFKRYWLVSRATRFAIRVLWGAWLLRSAVTPRIRAIRLHHHPFPAAHRGLLACIVVPGMAREPGQQNSTSAQAALQREHAGLPRTRAKCRNSPPRAASGGDIGGTPLCYIAIQKGWQFCITEAGSMVNRPAQREPFIVRIWQEHGQPEWINPPARLWVLSQCP